MATIYKNGILYSGSGEATVYDDMTGATSSTAGVHGLVPAPASGDNIKYLRGDGTWVAPDSTVTSGSGNPVTSGAVATAINNLPSPMVMRGTLGTNGTITTLPTASSSNRGDTYKVITDGTYSGQVAKVGDLFTSTSLNGSTYTWLYIPSGDDVEDTWRNVKINGYETLGTGISTGAIDFVNGSHTTVNYDATGNKVSVNVPNLATTSVPNVTSAGSAPTLGTAIPADDITAWQTNVPTEVTLPTYSVQDGVLTITNGTVTAGTAASLSYDEKSIPNVTSVGSAPTLGTPVTVATGFSTT